MGIKRMARGVVRSTTKTGTRIAKRATRPDRPVRSAASKAKKATTTTGGLVAKGAKAWGSHIKNEEMYFDKEGIWVGGKKRRDAARLQRKRNAALQDEKNRRADEIIKKRK